MQQMPLLEVTSIVRKMRLPIQPLALLRYLAHPADLRAIYIQYLEILALLSQFLCHSFDVNLEVVSQEFSDLGVLVVTY